jgi:Flp pilus assembly protein TadB
MRSKTRSTPVDSPAPGVIPDRITGPVGNGSPVSNGDVPTRHATPAHGGPASARGSGASERDERRHQRAIARGENGRKRDAKTDDGGKRGAKTRERLHQAKTQLAEPSRRGRLALGESVSLGLMGVVIVGLGVGAILGALGTPGWVVGLLVAALTLMLSAVLRRAPRQR